MDVSWFAALVFLLQPSPDAPLIEPLAIQEEWALRDFWQQPELVIATLELREGETVVDLGAGKGYFTHRLARAVGPSGRVLALDVNHWALDVNEEMCRFYGVGNVEFRAVPHDDWGVTPGEADCVFVSRTWQYLPNRISYANNLRSGLAAGGKLAVVGTMRESVPTPARFSNRFEIRREAEAAGFVLGRDVPVGPTGYVLVFEPGRADIYDVVPAFHYITSELALGSGVPDSTAFRALRARGFLTVIDVRQHVSDTVPQGVEPERTESFNWLRLDPEDSGFLLALCVEIDDAETGIVYVFGERADTVAQYLLTANRNKLLRLTEFEADLLYTVLDE